MARRRCPMCFSEEFYASGMDHCYICKDCDYSGPLFLELEDDETAPALRKNNDFPPVREDPTDMRPLISVMFLLLLALFFIVFVVVTYPHR